MGLFTGNITNTQDEQAGNAQGFSLGALAALAVVIIMVIAAGFMETRNNTTPEVAQAQSDSVDTSAPELHVRDNSGRVRGEDNEVRMHVKDAPATLDNGSIIHAGPSEDSPQILQTRLTCDNITDIEKGVTDANGKGRWLPIYVDMGGVPITGWALDEIGKEFCI